jgi:hypothetical protein
MLLTLESSSVNRGTREAALSAAEAIPRDIGREVTMILREVMVMVIESKSNVLILTKVSRTFYTP